MSTKGISINKLGALSTLAELRRPPQGAEKVSGGVITFTIPPSDEPPVSADYAAAIAKLDRFQFWRAGASGTYRPERGLWAPQRRAVAFAHAYICAQQHAAQGAAGEAALIKMPTGSMSGSGKPGSHATAPRLDSTQVVSRLLH